MPRYFMRDTPLAGLEKTMMGIPNFSPRGGGTMSYRYTAADCDCRYCIKNRERKKLCHGAADCICFEERLTARCWTHGELAGRLMYDTAIPKLAARTRQILPPPTPTPFRSQEHAQRMTSIASPFRRAGVSQPRRPAMTLYIYWK